MGYITGVELAIVHMANVLVQKTEISKKDLVKSFRETANLVSETAINSELIKRAVNHIADGIDGHPVEPVKLTLIQGGKDQD